MSKENETMEDYTQEDLTGMRENILPFGAFMGLGGKPLERLIVMAEKYLALTAREE